MLFRNGDGYLGGPLDVMLILHHQAAGTYHPAFFEFAPFPGTEGNCDVDVVRLRSRMHQTVGVATFELALGLLEDLALKIQVPASNVWRTEAYSWDGTLGLTLCVNNWTRELRTPS
jgi:hypothetical protein